MRKTTKIGVVSILVGALACLVPVAAAGPAGTVRVSISSAGVEADGESWWPSISRDGRFVAFRSLASNLLGPGVDTNGKGDIFVRNLDKGGTVRVSVSSSGAQSNGHSKRPSISADGRYVAFQSMAWNLVPGDTNQREDIFVHDLWTETTTRVSVTSAGAQSNHYSFLPDISEDGRFVAFGSWATNLVPGDTNGDAVIEQGSDVFVHDRKSKTTTRVSLTNTGGQAWGGASGGPSISADGRYVVFLSSATNLLGPGGDTNSASDVFVRDLQAATTKRVSVGSGGTQANDHSFNDPDAISADGRYVVFQSDADNLAGAGADTNGETDVFVHDHLTGNTTKVSRSPGGEANGWSDFANISADGRTIVYASLADNILGAGGDTNGVFDVFTYDRNTGITTRVSVSASGEEANDESTFPSISANGLRIAFQSDATNLLGPGGDTNGVKDVFVRGS